MKVGCKLHLEWPTEKLVQVAGNRAKWLAEGQQYRNHNSIVTIKIVGIADIPWRPSQWLECSVIDPREEDNTRALTNSPCSSYLAMLKTITIQSHAGDQRLLLGKANGTTPRGSQFLLKWSLRESKCVRNKEMEWWSSAEPPGCGEINI